MTAVTLPAAEYWEFKARVSEQARSQERLGRIVARLKADVFSAQAALEACQKRLSVDHPELYGTGDGGYQFTDETLTVELPEAV